MENFIANLPTGPDNTGPSGQNSNLASTGPVNGGNPLRYLLIIVAILLIGLGFYFLADSGLFQGKLKLQQDEITALKECVIGVPENIEGDDISGGFSENQLYNLEIRDNCAVEMASLDEAKAKIFYNKIISATPSVDDPLTLTFSTETNVEDALISWDFGDGTLEETDGEKNKTHTYKVAASYPVNVIVKKFIGDKELLLMARKNVLVEAKKTENGGGGGNNDDSGGDDDIGSDDTSDDGSSGTGDEDDVGSGDRNDDSGSNEDDDTANGGGDGDVGSGDTGAGDDDGSSDGGLSKDNSGDLGDDGNDGDDDDEILPAPIIPAPIIKSVTTKVVPQYLRKTVSFTYELSSTPDETDILEWSFDDNAAPIARYEYKNRQKIENNDGSIRKQYTTHGEHGYRLTIKDAKGNIKDKFEGKISTITANIEGCFDKVEGAHFYRKWCSGLNSSHGPDITYLWDYGDGTTSNYYMGDHTFPEAGKYRLKLTVKDEQGHEAMDSKELTFEKHPQDYVKILNVSPEIFSTTKSGTNVVFKYQIEGTPQYRDKFEWKFEGPGNPDTVVHYPPGLKTGYQYRSFSQPGTYQYRLTVKSAYKDEIRDEFEGEFEIPDKNKNSQSSSRLNLYANTVTILADTFHSNLENAGDLINPIILSHEDSVAILTYDLDSTAENIIKIRSNNYQWEFDIAGTGLVIEAKEKKVVPDVINTIQSEAANSGGSIGAGGGGGGAFVPGKKVEREKKDQKTEVKEGTDEKYSASSDSSTTPDTEIPALTVDKILEVEKFACLYEKNDSSIFTDTKDENARLLATIGFGENAIVQGFNEDGNIVFRGEAFTNRAEVLKILMVASCTSYDFTFEEIFRDIKLKDWHWPYVISGKKQNIVEGYQDKTFKPAKAVSRIEAIKMTARIAGIATATDSCEAKPFIDMTDNHWGFEVARDAFCSGIVTGEMNEDGRYLHPDEPLTRSQMALLIRNYYEAAIKASQPSI